MNLSAIGWPQGALGSGYPDAPKNLLPGRIEGWPQGTQSSANEAERLLSTAVAWWDADHYEDGDKILKNRGIAGELLDLQLGSNPRVPTTNDPLYLAPEETGYVYRPGDNYNGLTVEEESAFRITGDVDLRIHFSSDVWSLPTSQNLLSRWYTIGDQRAYGLSLLTNKSFQFRWSEDGTFSQAWTASSETFDIPDGESIWARVTLDVDNGSGGHEIKFYISSNGYTWTPLGTTVKSGTTTIYPAISDGIGIGASYTETAGIAGKIYRAILKDGIDGTTVLDVDCNAITDSSQASFQAKTGQTVTIHRFSSGRKSVAMPNKYPQKTDNGWSRGKPLFLFGSDDYMQVMNEWQHQLLNFDAGDSFTVVAVVRQWDTALGDRVYLSKRELGFGAGWILSPASSSTAYFAFNDGTTGGSRYVDLNVSQVVTYIAVFNRDSEQVFLSNSDTTSGTASTKNFGAISSTPPLRVGRYSAYQDFEFTAAAIFRRALTPEEIATITNYYQTTAPGFQGEPEITAIDLLESSVFWIDPNISEIV